MLRYFFALASCALGRTLAVSDCKTTPLDSNWPSSAEWASLNASIDGSLLRTAPAASSCWPGNPFGSSASCASVSDNWSNGTWHSMQPESIDYQLYANNSCLPNGTGGYNLARGCSIGGFPQYIVNATSEEHVATAMKWAADRNIRIVVKGTGHDLNGRSSGAYSVSIWTRNFRNIERNLSWQATTNSTPEDVFVVGSGQQWGNVLKEALKQGRVVTTGQDPSVGLGGYIQGGGHGPLASTYGLAANQVLQMKVVTTKGEILVANEAQNADLFWALRGGGAGQYGVVTEYVIKHFPAPANVTMGTLQILPADGTNRSAQESWSAVAAVVASLPDLMDKGLAGAATVATGQTAQRFFPALANASSFDGIALNQIFWAFNTTPEAMEALVTPTISGLQSGNSAGTNTTLSISFTTSAFDNYTSFFSAISGDDAAGGESIVSSRLLGRSELNDTPREKIISHLKTAMLGRNESAGSFATIGLSGGPGVHKTPDARWGAVLPAWRSAYLHFIANGASVDSVAAGSPKVALKRAADWYEEVKEKMWREWGVDSGAYMNEANPYNREFKKDFYGAGYEKLRDVKKKYDPTESLFVLSGVGSDKWDYDLDTGKLCRV